MNKGLILVVSLLLSSITFAQTTTTQSRPQGSYQGNSQAGTNGGQSEQARFAEHKQMIEQRQQARIQTLQQGLACIQAAQNHEALHQCMEQEKVAMGQHER